MSASNARPQRLAEQIKRLLVDIIRHEVKDPRVGLITLTHVEVSRDLSHAKIYVLPFDPSKKDPDWLKALASGSAFLRIQLKKSLMIRHVPELRFVEDESIDKALHLSKLIDAARRADELNAKARGDEPAEPEPSES